MGVSRGWDGGKRELVINGDSVSVWEDGKYLRIDGGDGCRTA